MTLTTLPFSLPAYCSGAMKGYDSYLGATVVFISVFMEGSGMLEVSDDWEVGVGW